MQTKQKAVLPKILYIGSWIIFIGLCIKIGAFIISYIVSINQPLAAADLYKGLSLKTYRDYNFWHYTAVALCRAGIWMQQALVAWWLIKLLTELNIERPLTHRAADITQKIGNIITGMWLLALLHNVYVGVLEKHAGIAANYVPDDAIVLGIIVLVLARVLRSGATIQTENDLTV